MQRIDFYVYDELRSQIDQMVNKFGFRSRAEFLRYAAIDFIRRDGEKISTDEMLRENTRAIRAVQSNKGRNLV